MDNSNDSSKSIQMTKLELQQQQSTIVENRKSLLLYDDENELVFSLLGRKCLVCSSFDCFFLNLNLN